LAPCSFLEELSLLSALGCIACAPLRAGQGCHARGRSRPEQKNANVGFGFCGGGCCGFWIRCRSALCCAVDLGNANETRPLGGIKNVISSLSSSRGWGGGGGGASRPLVFVFTPPAQPHQNHTPTQPAMKRLH